MRLRNAFVAVALFFIPSLELDAKDKDVPAWVTETATRASPAYSGRVPAVMLLDERRTTVDSTGALTILSRQAIKILNARGKGETEAAEYYMKGGRQVKALRAWLVASNGFVKSLEKGNVADLGSFTAMELYNDIRYRVIKADTLQIGDVFVSESEVTDKPLFAQDEFPFQSNLPAVDARYVLTLPAGWTVSAYLFNHEALQPIVNGSTYTWELKALPFREHEEHSPSMRGSVPRLAVNFNPAGETTSAAFRSWKDVSNWHTGLAAAQAEVTPELAAKAAELTAGAKTEYQRVQAIGLYVQKIRYVAIEMDSSHGGGYKPHLAQSVFQKQYGDCKDKANLMRALLKAVGVQSYLVSIYSGDRTYVRADWPSPQQFNHMILAVRVSDATDIPTIIKSAAGRVLIFDPTDDTTPMGDLPWYEQNSFALVIAGEQGELLRMPVVAPEFNVAEETVDASLSETGALLASVRMIAHGQPASAQRARKTDQTPEQYKAYVQSGLNRKAKDAVIGKLETSDEFEQNKFSVSMEFSSSAYGQVMQQRLLVFTPSVVMPQAPEFSLGAVRTEPIILRAAVYRKTVHVTLPTGFKVDELPSPVSEQVDFGRFAIKYSQENGELTMQEEVRTEAVTLEAGQYPKVKKFFDRVFGADNQTAVLVKN